VRKKAQEKIDRFTYGRAPASVFLVDLLNVEIELKTPDIGRIVRKIGKLLTDFQAIYKQLENAIEMDGLDSSAAGYLLALVRADSETRSAALQIELAAFEPKIGNLVSNILAAENKSQLRRMIKYRLARSRQRNLVSRMARNDLDLDEDHYDPTGVMLFGFGQLTTLKLRDFDQDREQTVERLWTRARSVSLEE
jgi:hypothetical protein